MTTVDSRQMALDIGAYVRTLSPSEALGCAMCLNNRTLLRSLRSMVQPFASFNGSVLSTLLARAAEEPAAEEPSGVSHKACPAFLAYVTQLEQRILTARGGDQE